MAHFLTLLSDTRYCRVDFAVTDCINLFWLPSISWCFFTIISLSLTSLFVLPFAVFGNKPFALAQTVLQGSLPSIYNRTWLRFAASWKCFSGRQQVSKQGYTLMHPESARAHVHSQACCWSRWHFILFSVFIIICSFIFCFNSLLDMINSLLLLGPGRHRWGRERNGMRRCKVSKDRLHKNKKGLLIET